MWPRCLTMLKRITLIMLQRCTIMRNIRNEPALFSSLGFMLSRGNSAYDNPAVISSCSPVINLMIFLMKVTSLPSTGCSVLLYGTEQRWPEETSSTHFWTAVNADSPPGSAATRSKIDVGSWQIAPAAIYVARCCLAMWRVQSLSRTISPHSVGLLLHLTRGNYFREVALHQTATLWYVLTSQL